MLQYYFLESKFKYQEAQRVSFHYREEWDILSINYTCTQSFISQYSNAMDQKTLGTLIESEFPTFQQSNQG